VYDQNLDTGAVSLTVKQRRHDTDHSPPSSDEIKNDGDTPSLPHVSAWLGA
jgi:hypothetical protein